MTNKPSSSSTNDAAGLSPIEYRVMSLLATPTSGIDVQNSYKSEFGSRLGPGTFYAVVKRLRDRRMLTERTSKEDRRRKTFALSGTGKRAYVKAHNFYAASTRVGVSSMKHITGLGIA